MIMLICLRIWFASSRVGVIMRHSIPVCGFPLSLALNIQESIGRTKQRVLPDPFFANVKF